MTSPKRTTEDAQRTRRSPGTGTLRERPKGSGHWELRAFIGPDPISGKPRQITRSFSGTEAKARRELVALVASAEQGKFDRTTATVGQLLDRWLEMGERSQRPRTYEENKRKIEHRIRPVLGKVRLDKLVDHPDILDAAYGRWLDEGLSPATV